MSRSGQSLLEVLIASAIGAILLVAAISAIVPSLRGSTDGQQAAEGATIARGLVDIVRVVADNDWHTIADLDRGTANRYHFSTTTSPFAPVVGTEDIVTASSTYTRSFFLEPVSRTSGGDITTSGGTVDPSTLLVIVEYVTPKAATRVLRTYITRSRTESLIQSDWSGGSGLTTPVTHPDSRFYAETDIDFSTTTGSIIIDLPD